MNEAAKAARDYWDDIYPSLQSEALTENHVMAAFAAGYIKGQKSAAQPPENKP